MTTQNLDYYRQRADEEQAAAERAVDPAIAQIHRDMAQRIATCRAETPAWPSQWEGHLPEMEQSSPDRNGNSTRPLPLNGCHIMVVEDEFLIADDIATMLREAGAEVIGPAASLPEGMRLASDTEKIDGAVLNIDLGEATVYPLADELLTRGVRIMFLTGYNESHIPAEYAAIPCCAKPAPPGCVIEELTALMRPIAA